MASAAAGPHVDVGQLVQIPESHLIDREPLKRDPLGRWLELESLGVGGDSVKRRAEQRRDVDVREVVAGFALGVYQPAV